MNFKFLPNLITLFNLFLGCIVTLLLIENNLEVKYVFTITVICLILDYLDGYIARKLNVKSDIGIQLDSLADMISFGLVPGIIIYNLFNQAPSSSVGSIFSSVVPLFSFLVTIASAIRLAKFNISKSNSNFFQRPTNTSKYYFDLFNFSYCF